MTALDNDAYGKKLAARFATFDSDGDSHVTISDFEGMARRILGQYDLPERSPKGQALVEGARHYFTGLAEAADSDRDGALTREEFVRAAHARLRGDADGFTQVIRPWATAVVDIADVNGDGTVHVAEWARMLRAMGATASGAPADAARVDADGDGVVSVDEVIASAVTFYTTDEPHDEFDEG
ncbi:EF-hand domain-containing protein [Streptomyces cavernicola]|uniref:EF-hand domain-containing protein n=1 Tax=Streptomyces cavernicola TaxID=3043613 RepID=A0ABT6S595_9ACTN|nr:EF-hand domain-containing protein [Streptomyces sp. B-S-A6]MDI3403255.1 EF-hand domain-containing protein [Streptomyces sp. B-S-A6]